MRRTVLWLGIGLAALVGLPPLLAMAVGPEPPALPPPGRRVPVAPGVAVNVLERGAGAPVVLVHGMPGTAYHWRAVAEELAARGHRVLAYDRVGYGRSDPRPDDDYTVEGNARELLALLEGEGLQDVTVVGWSFGGATAMAAALRDPSRFGRLVLVGSAGRWDDPPPPSAVVAALFSRPVMEWAAAVPPVFRQLQRGMGRRFFSEQAVPAWFAASSAASFAQAGTRDTWRREMARFRFDGPDPAGLAPPILLIHGDDDRVIPLAVAEGIHARAPGSRLEVVRGGSHALPATHPVLVAEHTAAFARGRTRAPVAAP